MKKMIKSYSELTLDKYYELEQLFKDDLEEIDLQVKIISLLTDLDEDDILNLPLDEYAEYVEGMSFLLTKPKTRDVRINTIELNGEKYEIFKQPEKMTAGQFIDYQTYLKLA